MLWLRRDLRLHDQPALHAAAEEGPVVALFVLDAALLRPAGAPRIAFLYRTLRSLDADLGEHGGRLLVLRGKPENVVPRVVREAGATSVHVSADFGPYGMCRDAAVGDALGAVPLVRTGSPYAVAPGRVVTSDGSPFKVFTPFYKSWLEHGWRAPAAAITGRVDWRTDLDGIDIPADPPLPAGLELPEAGETAARNAWRSYRARHLAAYPDVRDRPDLDRTSRVSPYLKWGCLHPRTLLADLGPADETYRKELAWREFYAAVLHAWPASAREYFQPRLAAMPYAASDSAAFDAWRSGRTGYPIVDAGMRQLLGEGWMHNRVRMIVASFLVKDLHIEWTHGARHFMRHLVDADLASNQHGWQWTAGTGTDAAPFFRVFNPTTQGRKFDPDGDYVRRWIPELRAVAGSAVHEPWQLADGVPAGYPPPIVDHAREREEALARYQSVR
ncbi:MAG: deoxyribodipyrimidine photo-lyase [Pseudonocardiales bacterium]|nr:deoxyribodipyrimidine photo-lyase [Pseudonocardiales bacterium]